MTLTTTEVGAPTLAERARLFAETSDEWLHRVRLDPQGRWYERIEGDEDYEVWIISWLPGQSTGFHDHGGSAGAFAVVLGELEEATLRAEQALSGGRVRHFGTHHIHDVRNVSAAPAVSVHVYSPPLSTMNRYDLTPEGELTVLKTESAEEW